MTPPPRVETPLAHRRNAVWKTLQWICQNLFAVWLGFRARGIENLPPGPALLIGNHQSFLDPMLIGLPLQRPVCFLARDTLFKVPVIGWILRSTYVMPIRRESAGTESLRVSLKRLEDGYLVGIFPEGTRSRDGKLGVMKPGFVALLRRAQVPVIPVAVSGAFQAMPRGAIFPKPRRVRIEFGAPISVEELAAFQGRGSEVELVNLVTERLTQVLNDADEWRRRG